MRALKSLLALMDFHMLVKIGLLCEAISTIRYRTHIRPLLSMDSKMVKEVVPLAENLFTVLVTARKESDDSSGGGTSVLKNKILLGIWDMLLYPYFLQIELVTVQNQYLFVGLDLLTIPQV